MLVPRPWRPSGGGQDGSFPAPRRARGASQALIGRREAEGGVLTRLQGGRQIGRVVMGSRVWIVILSLTACGRGAPTPSSADASAAGTADAQARAGEDGTNPALADAGSGLDSKRGSDTPSRPDATAAASPRRAIPPPAQRLIERRGDSEGPIPYRVVEPSEAGPTTPLVIALHGRGDTAEGFSRLVTRLAVSARVIVGEGPMAWGMMGGRQWYDMDSGESVAQIRQRVVDLGVLVDKLGKLYPEAGKPALFGFSQGAVVALQAALEAGDRFSAIAALSGYLASEDGATRSPVPVLVTGGTKDGIIPQERSWAAALALEKQGHSIERLPFEGPHGVPPVVIDTLRAFLVEHLARRDAPTPPQTEDARP